MYGFICVFAEYFAFLKAETFFHITLAHIYGEAKWTKAVENFFVESRIISSSRELFFLIQFFL